MKLSNLLVTSSEKIALKFIVINKLFMRRKIDLSYHSYSLVNQKAQH